MTARSFRPLRAGPSIRSLSALVKPGRFIDQQASRAALHVIVLSGFEAPDKGQQPQTAQNERDRDQNYQNIHVAHRIRSAFKSTVKEDIDMTSAAINGVAKPAIATGIAIKL